MPTDEDSHVVRVMATDPFSGSGQRSWHFVHLSGHNLAICKDIQVKWKWHFSAVDYQNIGISREVEFSGCPGTRQCLGTRGRGIRAWAEHALFLFCSCAFSKFFLEWGREADGTRGTLKGAGGEWWGISFIAFICCWLEAVCPTHSGLTDNTAYISAYICLYYIMLMMLDILHNAYDIAGIWSWMDGWMECWTQEQ